MKVAQVGLGKGLSKYKNVRMLLGLGMSVIKTN